MVIKTRIIAGALSVVAVFSVTTAATVSASAASTGSVVADAAYQGGLGILRQYVPGGQAIASILDTLISSLFGDNGPSLQDISDSIEKLQNEVSEQFSDIKSRMNNDKQEIENKIVDQTNIANKGNNFDTLMTALKATDRQIDSINNNTYDLNDNEKAVEIAALIGRNDQWTQSSNLHNQFLSFLDTLSTTSFGDRENRDFCQLIYNDCGLQVMFSGEAKDAAEPYIDRVLLLGLYAYSLDAQCLKAAQTVSQFTDEDIKTLDQDALNKYNSIKSRTNIINSEINAVNNELFNSDNSNSAVTHYNDFQNINNLIFINRNHTSQPLSAQLKTYQHSQSSRVEEAYNNVKSQICTDTISKDDMKALMEYINQSGMTVREYLAKIGFDVSSLSSNSYLTFNGGATDDGVYDPFLLNNDGGKVKMRWDYNCTGFYIDKNGTEENIQIGEIGYDSYWAMRTDSILPIFTIETVDRSFNTTDCAVAFVPA